MPAKKATRKVKESTVNLTIPLVSLSGEVSGELSVPAEIFGTKINKQLLAQAVRVYTNNQTAHFSNTKTRGEVEGSTRKIYQQKGTGRARHGGIRAPIFVGGGIALGPKSRKVALDLPKKMKRLALASALSTKQSEREVFGFSDLEQVSGKTKQIIGFLKKLSKGSALFIIEGKNQKAVQAIRNIARVHILPVNQVNALEVLKHQTILLEKQAIEKLKGVKTNA